MPSLCHFNHYNTTPLPPAETGRNAAQNPKVYPIRGERQAHFLADACPISTPITPDTLATSYRLAPRVH